MHDLDAKIASKTRRLALLTAQEERVRAQLLKLRNDLAHAQRDLDRVQQGFLDACNTHVRDANERLVIAALESATKAETAANEFEELSRSSQRDALTNTPNRTLMYDRLNKAIANAHRRGTRIALLFLDVDKFKNINDTYGHSVGDDIVKMVARRLESAVRDADTVSRHSGDEFLILLSDIVLPADAASIVQKILAAMAQLFTVKDIRLQYRSASVLRFIRKTVKMQKRLSSAPMKPCI